MFHPEQFETPSTLYNVTPSRGGPDQWHVYGTTLNALHQPNLFIAELRLQKRGPGLDCGHLVLTIVSSLGHWEYRSNGTICRGTGSKVYKNIDEPLAASPFRTNPDVRGQIVLRTGTWKN
jgi:hypothetical protein